MKIHQQKIAQLDDLKSLSIPFNPDLFLLFASPKFSNIQDVVNTLNEKYTETTIIGCSTAGEIMGDQLHDESVVLTAIQFEKTELKTINVDLTEAGMDSFQAGKTISKGLKDDKLRHIFVLSDGLNVNGAELVKGLSSQIDNSVSVTGGLAGDSSDFEDTFIIHNGDVQSKRILALGLYGDALKIGYGSNGGWESFGVERLVTKAENNILYELDGEPALALYKSFLGDKAKDLPGSGLLFPLSLRNEDNKVPVVRTILAVDEETQSLTFAGSIPQGAYVRLMKANVDDLIEGAEESAKITKGESEHDHQLAILISCVGRRLVMKQLVEEELEAVNDVFDNNIITTGFYSYGEIAPFNTSTPCALHNQTMTVTLISE